MSHYEMAVSNYEFTQVFEGADPNLRAFLKQARLTSPNTWAYLVPKNRRNDVDEAARLVKVALQQSATDPRTGTIDMDLIQTGVSSSLRQMRHKLEQEVRGCLAKAAGRTMTSSDLLRAS